MFEKPTPCAAVLGLSNIDVVLLEDVLQNAAYCFLGTLRAGKKASTVYVGNGQLLNEGDARRLTPLLDRNTLAFWNAEEGERLCLRPIL